MRARSPCTAPNVVARGPVADDAATEPSTPYGRGKLEGEAVARAAGAVALRLALVFGPGDRGNVATLLAAARARRAFVVESGANKKSIVYSGNVADRVALLLAQGDARWAPLAGGAFNVVDESPTQRALVHAVARAVGRRSPPTMPLAPFVLAGAAFIDLAMRLAGRTPRWRARVEKLAETTEFVGERIDREARLHAARLARARAARTPRSLRRHGSARVRRSRSSRGWVRSRAARSCTRRRARSSSGRTSRRSTCRTRDGSTRARRRARAASRSRSSSRSRALRSSSQATRDRGAGTLALAVLGYALPNGVLGAIDDYKPLRSRVKFGLQIAFAAAFVVVGPRVTELAVPPLFHAALGPLAAPFTALFLVWSTNVYNFMDGMDALAAGPGVVVYSALVAIALHVVPDGAPIAAVCAAAAAGLVGFLALNKPPARIFMGDGGALFVGALLGVVSVLVASSPAGAAPAVPFASVALAVGPFLWDATYTLFFRIARREDWLHPHRRHLFQRLALSGATHGRVRAVYFTLAVASAAAAVALPSLAPWAAGAVIAIALAAFSALSIAAGRAERAAATQAAPT